MEGCNDDAMSFPSHKATQDHLLLTDNNLHYSKVCTNQVGLLLKNGQEQNLTTLHYYRISKDRIYIHRFPGYGRYTRQEALNKDKPDRIRPHIVSQKWTLDNGKGLKKGAAARNPTPRLHRTVPRIKQDVLRRDQQDNF